MSRSSCARAVEVRSASSSNRPDRRLVDTPLRWWKPRAMGTSSEEAVQKFFAGFNANDVDAVAAVLAADFVYDDVGVGSRYAGKEQVVAHLQEVFQMSDVRWEVDSIFSSGDRVAVESSFSCEIPPRVGPNATDAPMPVAAKAATIFDTEDGLLLRLTDYHNPGF
jgi:ketosteroid isomerase-like protein